MMSLEQIVDENRKATNRAKRTKRRPFVPTQAQRSAWANGNLSTAGVSFPFIGDYVPKGWVRGEVFFVDTTGCGASNEPALTQDALARRLAKLPPDHGFATIEHGQMQCYIAVYRPVS